MILTLVSFFTDSVKKINYKKKAIFFFIKKFVTSKLKKYIYIHFWVKKKLKI